jgi:(S)-sulfolactate dehydrogenase
VAEYVVATAMLLLRGAYGASAEVAAGKWPRAALTNGREIGGKTLGLVGYGSIGQLTGRLARLLGVRVIAHDAAMPAGADLPSLALDALLAQADVVSLHVPLLDSTHHLIDARRLTAMKPGAVLINTARGGVVDEAALAEALRSGHLAGAALDVFEAEPLPAGSPLAGCPNLLLTPHIAGVTAEANERVSALIAAKVLEALA